MGGTFKGASTLEGKDAVYKRKDAVVDSSWWMDLPGTSGRAGPPALGDIRSRSDRKMVGWVRVRVFQI